jgi:hypothetical protein
MPQYIKLTSSEEILEIRRRNPKIRAVYNPTDDAIDVTIVEFCTEKELGDHQKKYPHAKIQDNSVPEINKAVLDAFCAAKDRSELLTDTPLSNDIDPEQIKIIKDGDASDQSEDFAKWLGITLDQCFKFK